MGRSIPEKAEACVEAADLMSALARRIRRLGAVDLAPLGVTHARLRALRHLAATGGARRMGELAAELDVVPRSVTTLVDELEASGWVRRVADPADRRATLVEVTDEGRAVTQAAAAARLRAAAAVLGDLSDDELSGLVASLRTAVHQPLRS